MADVLWGIFGIVAGTAFFCLLLIVPVWLMLGISETIEPLVDDKGLAALISTACVLALLVRGPRLISWVVITWVKRRG